MAKNVCLLGSVFEIWSPGLPAVARRGDLGCRGGHSALIADKNSRPVVAIRIISQQIAMMFKECGSGSRNSSRRTDKCHYGHYGVRRDTDVRSGQRPIRGRTKIHQRRGAAKCLVQSRWFGLRNLWTSRGSVLNQY